MTYSSLSRKSKRPNRKRHAVRPAWEDELETVTADDDPLRQTPEYRALVDAAQRRSGGRCELGTDPGMWLCYAKGTDPHHKYPTSEGGPVICPPSWLIWVCRSCHAKIHGEGRERAEANGWIVPKDRKPG